MSFKEWKHINLSDISLKITKGTTPSTIGSRFLDSGTMFFRAECLTDNKYIDTSNVKYIDKETHNKMARSQLKENDILFSMAGAYLGKTAIVTINNVPANINQAIALIRLNSNFADYNYVYYYLNQSAMMKYINNSSAQSAQPNINLKQIGDLPILLPSIKEQQLISKVLSVIDDKIEINNKINMNLQSIYQLLFKHWFVDFEFPNEEGLPYKSSGGEMVDSELGVIPKGWEVDTLNKIGIFKNGKGIKEELRTEKGSNFIFGSNGTIGKTNEILQHEPCIVVGRVGAYCGSIQLTLKPCWITDNAIIASPINKKYLSYLYLILLNSSLRDRAGGSAQPLINQSVLNNIKIVIPSYNLIEKYSDLVFSFIQKIDSNSDQNAALANLRDTLLPKLMNGEIDLDNIEIDL